MWDLDNLTGFAAGRNWIRDKDGAHRWLVAVKATFDITPQGELVIAEEQLPPLLEPLFRGDPATTSLVLDADLLSEKPGTDVVLDASAYAPLGQPAKSVEVSLRVGDIDKTLVVHGPRLYRSGVLGLTTSSSQPFIVQPIQYEWAFGGSDLQNPDVRKQRIDDRNPVGKGVAADPNTLYDKPAHVIEYPGGESRPAGLGPIASFWSPRRERAGTYDARWEASRKPLLPDDYDPSFALCAPDDQRCSRPLQGGESIVLVNMTPEGFLRLELPPARLAFETMFRNRAVQHRDSMLTTLFVAPDARKLCMVWQSALRVPVRDTEYLDFTVITEEGSSFE